MTYVADLHLHSRFSRACSKELTISNLAKWAKRKGIDLLGTSDFLHPTWREELRTQLRDLGNGFYDYEGTKFLLSTEISSIYSEGRKVRRIHQIIFLPSLSSADKLAHELTNRKVNITSDGRPITGISAHDLLEIVLNVEPKAILIPAHIWTPWFSLFGSMSGFNFLEECYRDLSDQVLAIETGESSDPSMNWRVSNLDKKAIVSFSDAHSLPNLGREATIFGGGLSFDELRSDLEKHHIIGTIEFFPEEGKYHYSGHRNCQVVMGPNDVKKQGTTCAVCQKGVTVGVVQRIEDLATRSVGDLKLINENGVIRSQELPYRPGYKKYVALDKIIADAYQMGRFSKKVQAEYNKLIEFVAPEIALLSQVPLNKIESYSGSKIAEGIGRMREGKVKIEPGYDGVYGKISLWKEDKSIDD